MFTIDMTVETPAGLATALAELSAQIGPETVNEGVARLCGNLVRAHFFQLARERHRPHVGQNFYADAADATQSSATADGAQIRVAKTGVAQRLMGGPIKAVNYPHLWIPVAPESEGKSAGEFDNLVPIVSPLTNKGVAIDADTRRVLFALVEELAKPQDPDPTVLPTEAEFQTAVAQAVNDLVAALPVMGTLEEPAP